jgi:hypothetical protein
VNIFFTPRAVPEHPRSRRFSLWQKDLRSCGQPARAKNANPPATSKTNVSIDLPLRYVRFVQYAPLSTYAHIYALDRDRSK